MGTTRLVNAFSVNDLEGILGGTAAGGEGRGGRREDNPLPSGLRVFSVPVLILKYFPCQLNIALRAARAWIVHQNRLSMTRSLRKTDTPRDDCSQDVVLKEVSQIVGHRPCEIGAFIVHCEENTFNLKGMREPLPHLVDGVHELRDALEGEKLALDGDEHRIGRH